MVFVKVIKSKSYFSRFQVKYRRRREGKTDYKARRKLVYQPKTKFNARKYRLVIRFTNADIVAQLISAHIKGDRVLTAAYGHELKRYGLPVGHTNYAASYAVGLLIARRALSLLHLHDIYVGNKQVGEDYLVEPFENGPRPFRAHLDTGLKRTTTGSKLFAALKGASDGGIYVPHSVNRFVGYNAEDKKLNTDVLRSHIYGGHVADYMRHLKEEDAELYKKKFSRYIKHGLTADKLEEVIKEAHAAIRAKPRATPKKVEQHNRHTRYHALKLSLAEKKKITTAKRKKLAAESHKRKQADVEAEGGGDEGDEEEEGED